MTPIKNNQGQQTELVKKQIVSYIRERKLAVGDKLPTQAELRTQLKIGSKTIQRAVHALAQCGVVELRGRSGVFVKSEDADGICGRQIGMVCMRLRAYPFGHALLQDLEMALHDRGCHVINFLRNEASMESRDSLDFFPGLRRTVLQHSVDALISTVPLSDDALAFCQEHNMPVCYNGAYQGFPHTVFIKSTTTDAFDRLDQAGIRRPGIFCSLNDIPETEIKIIRESLSRFHKSKWQSYVFTSSFDEHHPACGTELWPVWDEIVNRYLAMPENIRPDGIYIPDDFLTVYFVTKLLTAGIPLPRIITIRSKQIPLGMPFPLLGWYEVDVAKFAGIAADLTLELVNNPALPSRKTGYTPPYTDVQGA